MDKKGVKSKKVLKSKSKVWNDIWNIHAKINSGNNTESK